MMKLAHWAIVPLVIALAGCGGGGGSSPPSPQTTSLTLMGTAVKGAALAGAAVEVRCTAGSGSATTAADGSYSATITNGVLPCALRVALGNGDFVHSAIGGNGSGSFTVNLSPLTELVVAQAAGVAPDTLFTEFATRAGVVTTTALSDAVAAVKATLAGVIDLGAANPLGDTLVVGNALDQKIDALVAALATNGSSLAELAQTIAAASPVNPTPPPATSGTPSLPADMLIRPAAANCAALRSGLYRMVYFQAQQGGYATGTVNVDAAALTITSTLSGNPPNLQLVALGTCRFGDSNGSEVAVSQAGVISLRENTGPGTFRGGIAFPEQTHTVAEMAGAWNALGWERDSPTATSFHAVAFNVVFGSDGKPSSLSSCADVKTCVAEPAASLATVTLSANTTAVGGFALTSTDPSNSFVHRVLAYRAGGGELMAVLTTSEGTAYLMTHERVNDLPTAGTLSRSFDFSLNSALASTNGPSTGVVAESGNTILSVDAMTGAFTRSTFGYLSNGTVYATWNQSLQANKPRNGYTLRVAETGVPTSATGITATNREFVALGMRGMGFSAVELPPNNVGNNNGLFLLSMGQPGGALLPPDLIGKPFAANCSFLRSGTYRVVLLQSVVAGQFPTATRSINATTLLVTGTSTTDQWTANGNCRFTDSGGADIVVSPAGVIAIRGGDSVARIAFPEQAHAIAELAGSWNKIGFSAVAAGGYTSDAASATLDTAGSASAIAFCADVTHCVAVTGKTITLAVDATGGFDRTSSDGWTDRVFAFRAGNDDLMMLTTSGDGSIGFWTQQRVNALPTVGTRTRSWDLSVNTQLVPTLSESSNTIASVDPATNTAVRTRLGANSATWNETLKFNNPRDGYNFRPAGTTSDSLGAAVTINEFTSLAMRGMGFSPLKLINGVTSAESFLISVNKP